MLFVFICTDKPGHEEVRLDNRDRHLAYLAEQGERVLFAGPTLSEDGDHMTGSVLVLDFEDRAAAEAFAIDDPYARAGLFSSVDIRAWKKVLPKG